MTRHVPKNVWVAIVFAICVSVVALAPAHATGTYGETTGGVTHTWTNYVNAGGTEGPTVGTRVTVQVACRVTGFRVADGNTSWYRIASDPWNSQYYASADAFYNNGATSGSLAGTPFVDPVVIDCASLDSTPTPAPSSPTVKLAQGPSAPYGYRYAITLGGFGGGTSVSISCRDSVDAGGFYTFSMTTDGGGSAFTQSSCYSADGPDHWVVANGIESNRVQWGASSGTAIGGGGAATTPTTTIGGGSGGGTTAPPAPTYDGLKASTWAMAHAKDVQSASGLCTIFVSRALWAGGVPATDEWRDGTDASKYVQDFLNYFQGKNMITRTPITDRLSNVVPNAVPGDVIVYDWEGDGPLDHLALVVKTQDNPRNATRVSEWGTADASRFFARSSKYQYRDWQWSAKDNKPITSQKGHSGMQAWLVHIVGGPVSIGTY